VTSDKIRWWKADKEALCTSITTEIAAIESTQLDLYENYYYLAWLYDPYDYVSRSFFPFELQQQVTENVCCANVDTVTSIAARQSIRPVFLTDDGDWKTKRRAADLARYAEGIAKLIRLDECKPRMFKDAAIFGTGLRMFEMDDYGEIYHERFLPIEIRVSEEEALTQAPRHLHLLKYRDREDLMSRYPKKATELESTPRDASGSFFGLSGLNTTDQILVRYSWRLPIGCKGKPGYTPGRRVVSTANLVLVDEEYHDTRFPVAVVRWSERSTGWTGAGLVEQLQAIQRTINKMHLAHDQQIDLYASPITFVNVNDIGAAEKMRTSGAGRFVPVIGDMPHTMIPPVIAPESERRLERLSELSRTNSGISDMHASGRMPARLETGAAVRESNDVASERFSIPEKALERWYLDCIEVVLMLCKRNADQKLPTPDIGFSFQHVKKRIKWSEVDLKDVTYQLQAAPQLSRTLAGRMDIIATWQSSGLITPEQARHLIRHPDIDDAMSEIDSYLEYLDRVAELLLDGDYVAPDPRGELQQLGLSKLVGKYFEALNDGASEQGLECLRTHLDQMAFLIAKAQAPPPGAPPPVGPDGQPMPPGAMPPQMGGAPPMGALPPGPMPPG
jgi:hypothetical protein